MRHSRDKQSVIFEAFSQADDRPRGNTAAPGSACRSRKLVRLMGGEIWVDSELGHGSTFHSPSGPLTRRTAIWAAQDPLLRLDGRTVLVADDSPTSWSESLARSQGMASSPDGKSTAATPPLLR